jgi:predicted DNA-binding WGR domain protein
MKNEEGGVRNFCLRLEHRDPERRMARFYTMHLAPTLFGGWDLVREWGRIGSPGTVRIDPFETLEESERALRRSIEKQKRKRGYLSRGQDPGGAVLARADITLLCRVVLWISRSRQAAHPRQNG